jgi:hypothetical protein
MEVAVEPTAPPCSEISSWVEAWFFDGPQDGEVASGSSESVVESTLKQILAQTTQGSLGMEYCWLSHSQRRLPAHSTSGSQVSPSNDPAASIRHRYAVTARMQNQVRLKLVHVYRGTA